MPPHDNYPSATPRSTGADVVADIIVQHSIDTVFALAGASHTPLLAALADRGVRIVGSRHESATVAAADGYSRVTGRVGVALVIEEQGLPNAVGGLASAWSARSKVLVIAARSPHSWYDAESEYDFDTQAIVKPFAKWARIVPSTGRLAEYMDAAIRQASTQPNGPAVLSIARDHFSEETTPVSWTPRQAPPVVMASANPAVVDAVARRLSAARKPLIILGSNAGMSNCTAQLDSLRSFAPVPVLAQSSGRGILAEDNRGVFNWAYAFPAAREADFVIFLGGPISQRLGFGQTGRFSEGACIVKVDPVPGELHRFRWADYPIQSDISDFLDQLTARLRETRPNPALDPNWVYGAVAERRNAVASLSRNADRLHPIQIGEVLNKIKLRHGVIVGDGAAIQSWFNLGFQMPKGFRFIDHFPLGSMGVGTALAVGAAAGLRGCSADAQTILVTGDGSFGYYMAELSEAVRAGLRLVVIVGNDGAWGTELHGQLKRVGRSLNTDLGPQDFVQIAAGLGCNGARATTRAEFAEALDQALVSDLPFVIDAHIDRAAGAALKEGEIFASALFDHVQSHNRKILVTHASN